MQKLHPCPFGLERPWEKDLLEKNMDRWKIDESL
jgi:hypothetical protein